MSSKQILFNDNARKQLSKGLNLMANTVKITLGPRGRNVLLDGEMLPVVTKDGATVAREIEISNRFSNLGVLLEKESITSTFNIAERVMESI